MKRSFTFYELEQLGTRFLWNCFERSSSALHAVFTIGQKGTSLNAYGKLDCQYDELKEMEWKWHSIDGCQIKAPLARKAVGPNPTDKKRSKRLAFVDQGGVLLECVVAGANRHDSRSLNEVLEVRVNPTEWIKRNLCLDMGFGDKLDTFEEHGFVPTTAVGTRRNENTKRIRNFKPDAGP